ncbi:hypothetical protein M5G22_02460 [Pseudomonas sp. TNT2022 ID233]|uniref:hypothetical protein n=1 Tax=Pseudomonas aphyarum TaxID=2942629 RepID=UPI002360D0E6|nr:hypothetical protein [Pseudomonas aphyarum]MDD1136406.1 hypothetical protein [Pseudomonas aphyarum]
MDFDQIIYKTIAWLSIEHQGRRRLTYNVQLVFGAAMVIFFWFAGKVVLARRKAFLVNKAQELALKSLTAISFTDGEGQKVKLTGVLLEKEGAYTVTVTRDDGKEATVSSRDGLVSLEEVEAYLRAHTPFILSDFRR